MRELDKEERNPRYVMFILLVASVFTVLVARLFSLQILNASTYEERALQNRIRTNVIKATRGEIYDREGKLLAKNTTGYKLIHTDTRQLSSNDIELLRKIQNLDENQLEEALSRQKKQKAEGLKETIEDIRTISQITGYTTDYIITRFSKQPRIGIDKTILVIEDLDKNIALKAVEKIKNNRINIVEYNKRYYPEDSIASHVIGNVKPISEKEYDKEMKGQDGVEDVEVDVHGNVIKEIKNVSSITGKNIYLSIDLDLQKYMTQAFAGKSGAFIAMEVKTGKIITFVSYPEISLNLLSSRIPDDQWNELVNSKAKPLVNKGIAGLYPPGSTFKAITGLGILESGISPYDTVMSTGQYKFGKLIFRDSSSRGYGITNFNKSIEHSVNTYYYVFSQRAGKDNIIKYAKEMGVGEKTGIDIPGEQAGVLPTPEWKKKRFKKKQDQIWLPGDLINMSIGQGYVLMTPVQVLSAYQIIANNGVMIKPTVVDRFVSYDGKVGKNEPKILRKIKVSDKNLKLMQNALRLPVSSYGGTARVLYFPNFPVSAKTGTAQNTGFRDNHSWIAGYFPSDNPQIVFVSIIEGAGYGGVASGQLARTFIEKYRDKYEFKKNILPEQQNQIADNTGKKKKRRKE